MEDFYNNLKTTLQLKILFRGNETSALCGSPKWPNNGGLFNF